LRLHKQPEEDEDEEDEDDGDGEVDEDEDFGQMDHRIVIHTKGVLTLTC